MGKLSLASSSQMRLINFLDLPSGNLLDKANQLFTDVSVWVKNKKLKQQQQSHFSKSHFFKAHWGWCCAVSMERGRKTNNKTEILKVILCVCQPSVGSASVCFNHPPYRHVVQSSASEEPVDLFGHRVQVDVIETRPGGQTRDRGHLGETATESSFCDPLHEADSGHSCADIQLHFFTVVVFALIWRSTFNEDVLGSEVNCILFFLLCFIY